MNDALAPALPKRPKPALDLLQRLDAQDETIKELTALAQELCATVIALKAFANSVALSHPQPNRLLSVFQDHMDYAADALKPDQIAIYRSDMQQLQSAILLAVQRHDGKMP
jgi:hypothetical protein